MNENTLTRAQKRRLQQRRNDVQAALQHGPTKRLLRLVFDMTGLYASALPQPEALLMQAGRRNVGLDLMAILNDADPYAYAAILAETIKDQQEQAAEQQQSRNTDDEDV